MTNESLEHDRNLWKESGELFDISVKKSISQSCNDEMIRRIVAKGESGRQIRVLQEFIGIEYEGDNLSEYDGIRACKKLLESIRGEGD